MRTLSDIRHPGVVNSIQLPDLRLFLVWASSSLAATLLLGSFVAQLISLWSTASQPVGTEVRKVTASYYSDSFQGKRTASGERFDQQKLTAAHRTLPLGSKVEVEYPKTGKKAEVRINDRGPYVKGRELDLSKKAAQTIGMTKKGVATVKMTVESKPPAIAVKKASKPKPAPARR